MVSTATILEQLKAQGSEQTRKIYRKHGVNGEQYGVSYATLKDLKKKLKTEHELARQLWASGIHDARILALLIADPQMADSALLDMWIKDMENYPLSDAFSHYVAQTVLAREKMEQWTRSDNEWIEATGWNILGEMALSEQDFPDEYFEGYLLIIERDLHHQKNRVRHTMNNTLIAIGSRNPQLEEKALAAAQVIGKVVVDHGETSCKTPDAAAYIAKIKARKKAKG